MNLKNDQLSRIWNHLGDFWGRFEDKEVVEEWWSAGLEEVMNLYKTSYWVHYGKSIHYLSPIISGIDYYFKVYYGDTTPALSGLLNINISGEYNPGIGALVNIAQLTNIYYVDEDNPFVEEILVSGTDYNINNADREYIVFTSPSSPFTPMANQGNINYGVLHASGTSIVNPFLFNYWGRMVGIDIDNYTNGIYDNEYPWIVDGTSLSSDYRTLMYYKYFIGAMVYLRKQAYSLDVIENLLGIGYGLPFTFESGVVTQTAVLLDNTIIGISGETGNIIYRFPTSVVGLHNVSVSDSVDTFQLLISGFQLDDYISNSGLIADYAATGIAQYSTLVLTRTEAVSGLSHNETFVSGIIEDILPQGTQLHYRII